MEFCNTCLDLIKWLPQRKDGQDTWQSAVNKAVTLRQTSTCQLCQMILEDHPHLQDIPILISGFRSSSNMKNEQDLWCAFTIIIIGTISETYIEFAIWAETGTEFPNLAWFDIR